MNGAFSRDVERDARCSRSRRPSRSSTISPPPARPRAASSRSAPPSPRPSHAAEAAYKRDGQLTGVPTGCSQLDQLLGGLHRSDLIILAGRPSMGKTALATNIAFNAAEPIARSRSPTARRKTVDGAVVGFFSLEMSAEQLATRMLAEAGRGLRPTRSARASSTAPTSTASLRRSQRDRSICRSSSTTPPASPSPRCAPAPAG